MPKRVLLVEDEAPLRSALADILRLEGYEVDAVADGAAALERIARPPRPDLVVLDMIMPILSGAEFLIAARPLLADIPVVVMSGAATEPPAGAGVAVRLQKPLHPEELLQAVEYCLRLVRRPSRRRHPPHTRSASSPPAKQRS